MRCAETIGIRQPLSSAREDGVSHEHNRDANGGETEGNEGKLGHRGGTKKDSSKDQVAGSRGTKQPRLKQGMRGSCARASQHRFKTFKITSKGTKAGDLLDHESKRRAGKLTAVLVVCPRKGGKASVLDKNHA